MKYPRLLLWMAAVFAAYVAVLTTVSLVWVMAAGMGSFIHDPSLIPQYDYPTVLRQNEIAIGAVSVCVFLLVAALYYRLRGYAFSQVICLKKVSAVLLFRSALLGVVLNLAVVIVLNLLPAEVTAEYGQSVDGMLDGNTALALLNTAVIAPITEELLYRGLILSRVRRCFQPVTAAVIVSLLFGFMHGEVVWMIYATVLGLLFSWLIIKTESIFPPMCAHFFFNLTSVIIVMVS